jgi:DNA polymerase III subunit chi
MTEVAFHFNAPQKRGYACRLLRKAYLKGARLVVLCEQDDIAALDAALWTFAAGEFVPHSSEGDVPGVKARSPIRLVSDLPADLPDADATVLVNLTHAVPLAYQRFGRVIEVVATDPGDKSLARERWRQYLSDGVEPQRHDLNLAPNA